MQRLDKASAQQDIALNQRKPWTTPAMQKMRAGEAEVGTRSTPDGAFTTS